MNYKLDDDDGLPWTAHLGLSWIVLILAITSGVGALLLGVYLSLWMYQRARSTLPLLCFVSSAIISLLLLLPLHGKTTAILTTLGSLSWLIKSFSLRGEILLDGRAQGIERSIGPLKTLFFSVAYLNYCLNPDVFPRPTRSDPISLYLRK